MPASSGVRADVHGRIPTPSPACPSRSAWSRTRRAASDGNTVAKGDLLGSGAHRRVPRSRAASRTARPTTGSTRPRSVSPNDPERPGTARLGVGYTSSSTPPRSGSARTAARGGGGWWCPRRPARRAPAPGAAPSQVAAAPITFPTTGGPTDRGNLPRLVPAVCRLDHRVRRPGDPAGPRAAREHAQPRAAKPRSSHGPVSRFASGKQKALRVKINAFGRKLRCAREEGNALRRHGVAGRTDLAEDTLKAAK